MLLCGEWLEENVLRAPMSLEKMSYDAKTGTVIYRSKMHAGLKRNFQVMPGREVALRQWQPLPHRRLRLGPIPRCRARCAAEERHPLRELGPEAV